MSRLIPFSSYSWRAALACLCLFALGACSPEYNWREVRYPEHGVSVMLPGKPDLMTRRIQLDDLPVDMTMFGAQAGGSSFAVGLVRLPPQRLADADKARAAMRAQMVRNLAGAESSAETVLVKLVDELGEVRGGTPGLRVAASGTMQGKPGRMLAGFVAYRDRVYQYVVIGPSAGFNDDEARLFLDSIKLQQ